jgi:hypothetical protein
MPSVCAERRVLVLALLCAWGFSCGQRGACDDPVEVLSAFFENVDVGDQETAFGLLDKPSRGALEKLAAETKKRSGSVLGPHEFLVPTGILRNSTVKGVAARGGGKGGVSRVIVTYADGTSAPFPMSREGNCYKVHLEL